jgi:hypothetical protein
MAGSRLSRIKALEGRARKYIPGAWIEALDGETAADAVARYDRETAPLNPDAMHIVWLTVKPGDLQCAN